MGFKIFNEDEPMTVNSLVVVFYGEPGIGKTSLAFTAEKPLLEDYDDGVKRSVNRKSYLKVDRWEDAVEFHNSADFETFAPRTLIIDTAGTCLDNYMAQYVIRQDIKNARNGGELSLQGYGAMKSVFRQFVTNMKSKGIDLIFICHAETMKEGDSVKFIPKMTGGSYDILIESADILGYIESRNNKRTINFNPTDRSIGKNTAEFPVINIPHYTDNSYQSFAADLITKTKAKMIELSKAQQNALSLLNDFRNRIDNAASMDDLDKLIPEIEDQKEGFKVQLFSLADSKYHHYLRDVVSFISRPDEADEMLRKVSAFPKRYQDAYKKSLWDHCKSVGLDFDKKSSKFQVTTPDASNSTAGSGTEPVTKQETETATTKRRTINKAA